HDKHVVVRVDVECCLSGRARAFEHERENELLMHRPTDQALDDAFLCQRLSHVKHLPSIEFARGRAAPMHASYHLLGLTFPRCPAHCMCWRVAALLRHSTSPTRRGGNGKGKCRIGAFPPKCYVRCPLRWSSTVSAPCASCSPSPLRPLSLTAPAKAQCAPPDAF